MVVLTGKRGVDWSVLVGPRRAVTDDIVSLATMDPPQTEEGMLVPRKRRGSHCHRGLHPGRDQDTYRTTHAAERQGRQMMRPNHDGL